MIRTALENERLQRGHGAAFLKFDERFSGRQISGSQRLDDLGMLGDGFCGALRNAGEYTLGSFHFFPQLIDQFEEMWKRCRPIYSQMKILVQCSEFFGLVPFQGELHFPILFHQVGDIFGP